MKFILSFLIALLLPSFAQAQLADMPSAPVLAAKSYLLYDYTSNQILIDQNGNERTEPASITKLMTAYLTFNSLKLNKLSLSQSITPSEEALRAQGVESRMFLDKSKSVTIAELLRGLIVQSGNDAARVLATTIGGSEESFAKLMNQEAKRLGMINTNYVNSTGMPHPQHYSSAYDTALLAAAIVRNFPEYYSLYSLRDFQYNNINQANRNRLLWMDPYVDGMKTGHTESAGYCLVASAKRNQRRLISVVLGAQSDNLRATESQKLLNYGFQNFEAVRLYQKNEPVASLRLWKGTETKVKVGFRSDLFLSIPTGQLAQLKVIMQTQQPLIAPIAGGQKIGILKITLAGKPYADYKLVALEPVPLANVFSRGWDSIR
ncbi:MAG: D-alanyl-D-alanine carboxypeptidase family protein [Candidatus Nitrotoga sp.]